MALSPLDGMAFQFPNHIQPLDYNKVCFTTAKDKRTIGLKMHSTPLTLKWLSENYEPAVSVCIPRSQLYQHYLDFCRKNSSQPVNPASFGKIIRQQFPNITTRRLGTRGQSKYHYYGIGVKETSQYYDIIYSKFGAQSSECKRDAVKQSIAYSPRSKLGTLLPDFPAVPDLHLPLNTPEGKVTTFIMMYRTHCQRILDTVVRANFEEVQNFLQYFWQGMPQHVVPILSCDTIVSLVGVCDSILYQAISKVLMPSLLQPLPESLTQVIRRFARQFKEWLKVALQNLPVNLQRLKYRMAKSFCHSLTRQTSLNHLCQAARGVVSNTDLTTHMLDDWGNVDLFGIYKQILYTVGTCKDYDVNVMIALYSKIEKCLEERVPLESYVECLEMMIDTCVIKKSLKAPGSLRNVARQFLLLWSNFGTRVIRDMTLHSAPSFGSFHLMHLMFDDYIMYKVEELHRKDKAQELLLKIKGNPTTEYEDDEPILPSPLVVDKTFVYNADDSTDTPPARNLRTFCSNSKALKRPIHSTHTKSQIGVFQKLKSSEDNVQHDDAQLGTYQTPVTHSSGRDNNDGLIPTTSFINSAAVYSIHNRKGPANLFNSTGDRGSTTEKDNRRFQPSEDELHRSNSIVSAGNINTLRAAPLATQCVKTHSAVISANCGNSYRHLRSNSSTTTAVLPSMAVSRANTYSQGGFLPSDQCNIHSAQKEQHRQNQQNTSLSLQRFTEIHNSDQNYLEEYGSLYSSPPISSHYRSHILPQGEAGKRWDHQPYLHSSVNDSSYNVYGNPARHNTSHQFHFNQSASGSADYGYQEDSLYTLSAPEGHQSRKRTHDSMNKQGTNKRFLSNFDLLNPNTFP